MRLLYLVCILTVLNVRLALGENCSTAKAATLCLGQFAKENLDTIDCGFSCDASHCCGPAGQCSLYSGCSSLYNASAATCTATQDGCTDAMCCLQRCPELCSSIDPDLSIIDETCNKYSCTQAECCKDRDSCPGGSSPSGKDRCECDKPSSGTIKWKKYSWRPWKNHWDGSCTLTCMYGNSGTGDPNGDYSSCDVQPDGGTCTPDCQIGYEKSTSPSFTLDCSSPAGYYDATVSSSFCEPLNCSSSVPTSPDPNALYTACVGLQTAETCVFDCAPGYYASPLSGFPLVCLPGGSWSAVAGKCVPYTCTDGPWGVIDAHANYDTCVNGSSGDTCNIGCTPGYHPSDGGVGFKLVCQPILNAGFFFQPTVTCQPDACNMPPVTPQTNVNYDGCNGAVTDQWCEPVCDPAVADFYHMTYPGVTLNCTNGAWDDVNLKCLPNSCSNGVQSPQPNTYYDHCDLMNTGDTCIPTCDDGYRLVPSIGFTLSCYEPKSGGTQYSASASCAPNTCVKPIIQVDNVVYDACSGLSTSEPCQPDCIDGWTVNGTVHFLTCSEQGYYNASNVSCTPNKCSGGPSNPQPNAHYVGCSEMNSGLECSVECDEGYTATPPQLYLVCGSDNKFDASLVECVPHNCLQPRWHASTTDPGPYNPYTDEPVTSYDDCIGKVTDEECVPVCRKGYTSRITSFTMKCSSDLNGNYFYAVDNQCIVNNCTAGPLPNTSSPFGDYSTCDASDTDQRCEPECFLGYELLPAETTVSANISLSEAPTDTDFNLMCFESGYNASALKCEPRSCKNGPYWPFGENPGPFTSNGTSAISFAGCTSNVTDQLCYPSCANGYSISHDSFMLSCNENNTFLVPHSMTCIPRNCSGGPSNRALLSEVSVASLEASCSPKDTDLMCDPECGLFHTTVGNFRLECDVNNQYHSLARCEGKLCTAPSNNSLDIKAIYSDCRNKRTGGYCDIECAPGYEIQAQEGKKPNSTLGPLYCDANGEFAAFGVRCAVTICAIGQYVKDYQCIDCPEGTTTTDPQPADYEGRTWCVPLDELQGSKIMLGRLAVLSRLGCEHEVEKPDDLPWQLHPARFSLGNGRWNNYVGAIVGNLLTLIGFSAALRVLAFMIKVWDHVSSSKSKYTLHFPGILIMPYSFLSPGFVMGGFRVCSAFFADEAVAWEFLIGIFGVGFSIGVPAFVYYRVIRTNAFDAKLVRAKSGKTARFFWGGHLRWVNTTRRPFVEKYGAIYDCFKEDSTYFALLDLLITVVLTLITTIPISDIDMCNTRNWVVVGLLGFFTALYLWKWPLLCQFLNIVSFFNQVCQVIGITMLSQGMFVLADISLTASALLAAVKFTFDILMALRPEAQQIDDSDLEKKASFLNFSDGGVIPDSSLDTWEPLVPIGSDVGGERVEFENFDGITPELLTELSSEKQFDI